MCDINRRQSILDRLQNSYYLNHINDIPFIDENQYHLIINLLDNDISDENDFKHSYLWLFYVIHFYNKNINGKNENPKIQTKNGTEQMSPKVSIELNNFYNKCVSMSYDGYV